MQSRNLVPATIGLLVIFAAVAPGTAQELAGCWVGEASQAGQRVGAILELEGSGSEVTGGMSHLMVNYLNSRPVHDVSVDGSDVSFTIEDEEIDASFTGRVADGELSGTVEGPNANASVELTRTDSSTAVPARGLVGYWEGGLVQGSSVLLNLGLRVEEAPCGQVIATLDSPDQGVENIPISSFVLDENTLRFAVSAVGGSFEGTVTAEHTSLRGAWSQGGQTVTLRLRRD